MSNYKSWDLYSLGKRALMLRQRVKESKTTQQMKSYLGELVVVEEEYNRKFFTGPYFPNR